MEDIETTDDQFTWNPDAKDEFNNSSVKFRDGSYLVTADNDIARGSIIYKGEALTTRISSIDTNLKIEYAKWAARIMQDVEDRDKYLLDLYPRYGRADLNIHQITKKLSLNAFGVNDKLFLFIGASKFNHSCVPNAIQFTDPESNIMAILALRDIKKDEEITISYFEPLSTIDNIRARARILAGWRMKCRCSACLDQSNPQPLGYVIDSAIDINDWLKDNPINNCVWCGEEEAFRVCSECGIPKYCSKKCQTRHWQFQHKSQCSRWSQRRSQLVS